MWLVMQTHFATKRYNRPGMVWNSVVRPCSVVEVLYLSGVVVASNLERPNDKVSCLFRVHQSNANVTVQLLLACCVRPIQLALRLSTQQYEHQINHQIFCTCYQWPWLRPPLVTVQYAMYFSFCGRCQVFTWWTELARIKEETNVSFTSPGGGTSWTSDNVVWSRWPGGDEKPGESATEVF